MSDSHIGTIAGELAVEPHRVQAAARLLAEGATVPFIARYRKEATHSLDEVAITTIRDRLEQLAELDRRRDTILTSLGERGLLTPELEAQVRAADRLTRLEDLYLPYRPKRRTRAMAARERGLAPLADRLLDQSSAPAIDPAAEARAFIDEERGVPDSAAALGGARDIIAERIHEDGRARERLRRLFAEQASVHAWVSTDMEAAGAKYRDYFDWTEPAARAPSHRVLAMMRGEKEGFLVVRVAPPEEAALSLLERLFVKGPSPASEQVALAVRDAYKRLLAPALATELRAAMKQRADAEAIRVFAENLRELLLAPPLGQKRVLALDPAFRTGCKLACLDAQGKLLHHETIHPHTGGARAREAAGRVHSLCDRFEIEAVAIGNGTAGRETEAFVRGLALASHIVIVMVNEAGASVYSASEAAREEFPDQDITVRGAVSIARRLMDPLAELIKIDPKAIGVGQYQHDVDQSALKRSLDDVVISCVNGVGVDVNTASRQLLTYVSGLGPGLAKSIVAHREQHGPFARRRALLEVPRLGPKAFEQAAGFLRIPGGQDPLDASAVHPERYAIVDAMAADLGRSVDDLIESAPLREAVDLGRYVSATVGWPTLRDIMAELARPGRDPRATFEPFQFAEGLATIEDVQAGMCVPGVVTNVTAFGAFVDIGVHQDGLVHISQLADRFVRDPSEVVKVHQPVMVTVLAVDQDRKRISLSMRSRPGSSCAVSEGTPVGAPAGRGRPPGTLR